ncbi:hypothetical protein MLD38_014591 [Melastoma candidum]|uniref:Uncharacterized protein n=1 Tax=Melastoma candidum TaxID=119954 RepID=A0ACB9REG0_9MYRT|nr:hypothetical protein MLD38_014591 [Melastoma candidum]
MNFTPSERKTNSSNNEIDILNQLRTTSKDLQSSYTFFLSPGPQPIIHKLLSLANQLNPFLQSDPRLYKLTQLLSDLRKLHEDLESSQGYGVGSFLRRQRIYYNLSWAGLEIDREIQAYVDKEAVSKLVTALRDTSAEVEDDDEKVRLLIEFEERLAKGFDRGYQDQILTARVFNLIDSTVCEPRHSARVREHAGCAIVGLVQFNRNVFVGLVLMGSSVDALISIGTYSSIKAVASLVSLIKSPLIDEMDSRGEIARIIDLLKHGDEEVRAGALDCICEVAYHGRKEVIEGIVEAEVVELLVELQRWNYEWTGGHEEGEGAETSPFAGCVARFAVQVEVGEGMNGKEKGEFKLEVLRRVKEACADDDAAASASICADVLWGSSP